MSAGFAAAAAQEAHPACAGVRFGEGRAAVNDRLQAAGFAAVAGSDDDIRLYHGSVLDDTAMVFATFENDSGAGAIRRRVVIR